MMYFTLDICVQDHLYDSDDGVVDMLLADKQIFYEDYRYIQDLLIDLRHFNVLSDSSLVYSIYYCPNNGDDNIIDITDYVGIRNNEQSIICLDPIIKQGGHAEHFK